MTNLIQNEVVHPASAPPDLIFLARDAAARQSVWPELICAIVEQESSWDPWALRYEPAFYTRYVEPQLARGAIAHEGEARARAFSWGLMQVMGQVAREHGFAVVSLAALCDPALYDVDPENAWRRLKPRRHTVKYLAVFRAVAAWRERTAQQRDQPRGRILKDEAIDELAAQAPTEVEALNRLRSVPKGFGGSRFGPELIDAIAEALKDPESYAPKIEREAPPATPAAGAVVELLKVLLKARAEDAGVASKLIATVSDLEKIASDDRADSPALHGWRREAFGEDALKLKRGELALVLDGARVRVVPVRRAARASA
jgi:hypothetical protein